MSYLIVGGLAFVAGLVVMYLYYRDLKAQLREGKLTLKDWLDF